MSRNIAFYVHHHGSGHLMRALAIASQLNDVQVTFLGSGLARFQHVIPDHIHCIHLPDDVAGPDDVFAAKSELSFLHYVPVNVEKVTARAAAIAAALHALFPVILVVDVSVEVTLLATLCGIPVVVMRQNGDRDDSAHLHAYECAQLLIAPSPQSLMDASSQAWVQEKTFFSGGFSKYSVQIRDIEPDPDAIGLMVGSGGTSLNGDVVNRLAAECPNKTIHVLGDLGDTTTQGYTNVVFHGQVDEPLPVLLQCHVVIGNAGHNTVMEMADLNKKFICIPEERPFREQVRKAELLAQHNMAVVVGPEQLHEADWPQLVAEADALPDDCWQGVMNESALADLAGRLRKVLADNFSLKE